MKTNLILFAVLFAAIVEIMTMSTATMVAYGGWGGGWIPSVAGTIKANTPKASSGGGNTGDVDQDNDADQNNDANINQITRQAQQNNGQSANNLNLQYRITVGPTR